MHKPVTTRPSSNRNLLRRMAGAIVGLMMTVSIAQTSLAGGGPENVFLVVNGQSRSSKVIANHYVSLRNIPPSNVIYLTSVPTKEIIPLADFREKILEPVLQAMVTRQISGTIDYIIYSSDFPTRISIAAHQEILKKSNGKSFQSKIYAPIASITSLTYYAANILSDDPTYMALNSNRYYRIPYRSGLATPFEGTVQTEYRESISAFNKTGEEFEAAKVKLLQLCKKYPGQSAVYYQLAKFFAKDNEAARAIQSLSHAAAMGWQDASLINREKAFDNLRSDPKFEELIQRISKINSPFIAPHGFRNAYSWAPNGMINRIGQGRRYFLSAMLSVTRDNGISDRDSLEYLSRAVYADDTQPKGTIYYTQTKDVRSTTRLGNFNPAMKVIREMGHEARIEKSPLPSRRGDVMGLTCGTAKFDFEASGCTLVPGAFADNLTSAGGIFITSTQTKLTEFLRFGAAGASGTVVEPYALQAKFPHPMVHAHYLAGCSLAEAFYQSVHGPYQIILVADPLCQPFANRPKIAITSPKPKADVSGKFKIDLSRDGSQVTAAGIEIFLDGTMIHRGPNRNSISLDTADLNDGYHELRIVSVARDAIESRGTASREINVNNKGHYTKISTAQSSFSFPAQIKVDAETNFGEKIVIRQNSKTVGVITSQKGSTDVSTASLGVGDIELQAISYREGENTGVASPPIAIRVTGSVSTLPDKK